MNGILFVSWGSWCYFVFSFDRACDFLETWKQNRGVRWWSMRWKLFIIIITKNK
jgi:hypothetical protein